MKVLIVDDEPLARGRLRDLLGQSPDRVVEEAEDGPRALLRCAEGDIDLVLLDIAMPGMDGLEVARHLASQPQPPAVVFCTAYDQHALAAFDAAAVDYLLKPVRADRLDAAVQRAAQRRGSSQAVLPKERERSHLAARLGGSLRLIPIEAIRYLQAEDRYVRIHHARGEDLVEETLKSLEREFGERFVRIHRNCLVALAQVVELRRSADGQYHALLRDSRDTLEVSRRALPALRERLGIHQEK